MEEIIEQELESVDEASFKLGMKETLVAMSDIWIDIAMVVGRDRALTVMDKLKSEFFDQDDSTEKRVAQAIYISMKTCSDFFGWEAEDKISDIWLIEDEM